MNFTAQTVTLREWGGQRCDVEIHRREDKSVFVTFKCQQGYGYPMLELDRLKAIVEQGEQMERGR